MNLAKAQGMLVLELDVVIALSFLPNDIGFRSK